MELPVTKRMPLTVNPRSLVLYGTSKIGKTTFLSQLEDCLILDLEGGSSYVSCMSVNVTSLKELQDAIKSIKAKKKELGHNPYKYIAIDTLTTLEEWLEEPALKMYQETPMGASYTGKILQLPKGAGYYYLREAYKQYFDILKDLADNVIFIGHVKDSFKEEKGQEVKSSALDLTGKIKNITCASVDAIGYMYRDNNGTLLVSFKSNSEVECGSRCDHLRGQVIEADWSNIFV